MTRQQGFTLIEILISLAIFAVIVIGAMSVLGAASTGGFFGTFPVGFQTTRVARDYTAATVHIQALHEFFATKGSAAVAEGNYCTGPDCSPAVWPSGWSGAPAATPLPYQLDLRRTDVVAQQWRWDAVNRKYCVVGAGGCSALASADYILYVQTTLTWRLRRQAPCPQIDDELDPEPKCRHLMAERFIP